MQQKGESFPEPALADVHSGSQPSQPDAVAIADQLHNGVCLPFPREGGIAKGIQDLRILFAAHQEGIGPGNASARPADLLIIGYNIGRHPKMDHESNVSLIIPHPSLTVATMALMALR